MDTIVLFGFKNRFPIANHDFAEANKTLPQNIAFGIKVGVVKDILYEEGISFTGGQDFWFTASQEKIAQLAKDASVVVNCHSSL